MLTIYKASAGSGKTYTLVLEYIKLLLGRKEKTTGKYTLNPTPQQRHRAILAITFTNKATEEMKHRIVKDLALLARVPAVGDSASPYAETLTELFDCTEEELSSSARTALYQLLFDFDFFNISTIDSFFQTVLRTFAQEADLTGNYDIELNDDIAISSSVNELLNSINYDSEEENGKLVDWLKRYMNQRIREGMAFNLFNRKSSLFGDLLKFLKRLFSENFKIHADELTEYLSDKNRISGFEKELTAGISKKQNRIISKAKAVTEIANQLGIDLGKCVNSYILKSIGKWSNGEIDIKKGLSKTCLDVITQGKSPFTSAYLKKNAVPPESLASAIAEAIATCDQCIKEIRLYKNIRDNIYGLGLMGETMEFVMRFRKENNLILLSDTNDLLQRIIRQDDAPFIYERLGIRLNHFLIDEFQDTSHLQWNNLSPLVSESLANGNDNLIIGDEKQCIYRFRNSDPSLLRTQVSQQFKGKCIERGNNLEENTNWRSSSTVVEFNNRLFTILAKDLELDDIYGNVRQQVASKNALRQGYVKFRYCPGSNKAEIDDFSLSVLADDIRRQLSAGYRPCDIAILVRKKDEGERAIAYLLHLMEEKGAEFPRFNIVSDESLKIGNSPMVKLIVSLLRMIDSPSKPKDENTYRRVTMREINNVVCQFEFYLNKGLNPEEALDKAVHSDPSVMDEIVRGITEMACISLPSIVERIIARFVPQEARIKENVFISAFQDDVIEYCSRNSSDIHSFLQWWDDPSTDTCIASSSEIDAVRVMTIHKSKGLEFKCVNIPFADWKMTSKDREWFTALPLEEMPSGLTPPLLLMDNDKSLLGTQFEEQCRYNRREGFIDNLNGTYVAFTRAIDELCVTYDCSKNPGENPKLGDCLKKAFSSFDEGVDQEGNAVFGAPSEPSDNKAKADADTLQAPPYLTCDHDEMWNLTSVDLVDNKGQACQRGVFLHDVMSMVRDLDDVPAAVRRRAYKVHLGEEETEKAIAFLTDALADPQVKDWFSGYQRVLCERSIALPSRNKYRPDRIVWTADGHIDIIDYKFGIEHEKKYADQVRGYMKLLSSMGHADVRGFLWYPDNAKIVEVPFKPRKSSAN